MEEVYKDMVTQDDLSKIDTQPNPFNFSERVSQTNRFARRVSGRVGGAAGARRVGSERNADVEF